MSRVAFIHNALGKTDGVSLEVDKWRVVLERMGHEVFYCAGNDDVEGVFCIPELSFNHPVTYKILRNATVKLTDYNSEEELKREIEGQARTLKKDIINFIRENKIEVLIPNNLLSVGYHIPAVLALNEVIKETKLPAIVHSHDFYFEDSGEVEPTCKTVWDILDNNAPPQGENVKNIVINYLAKKQLEQKKGITAEIVPNVFDFKQNAWEKDEYNRDFRKNFGIKENDIVFLQATRILDRKGIESAIEVIAKLNKNRNELLGKTLYNGKVFTADSRNILLCAGYVENFGISGNYYENIKKKAVEKGVEIKFIGSHISRSRGKINGEKIYSLWDSYVYADIVTYPSLWEGWGNQFIEAVFAKLPIIVFEYPVYISDLKKVGFDIISLGDKVKAYDELGLAVLPENIISEAVQKIISVLQDKEQYKKIVDKNYKLAENNFSLEELEKIVRRIMQELDN